MCKIFEAKKWETVEPEEEELELGCKVGVGEQVVQRVKVPAKMLTHSLLYCTMVTMLLMKLNKELCQG